MGLFAFNIFTHLLKIKLAINRTTISSKKTIVINNFHDLNFI